MIKAEFISHGIVHTHNYGITITFMIGEDKYFIEAKEMSLIKDTLLCVVRRVYDYDADIAGQIKEFKRTYGPDYGYAGKSVVSTNGNFMSGRMFGTNVIMFFLFGELYVYYTETFLNKVDEIKKQIMKRSKSLYKRLYKQFSAMGKHKTINHESRQALLDKINDLTLKS